MKKQIISLISAFTVSAAAMVAGSAATAMPVMADSYLDRYGAGTTDLGEIEFTDTDASYQGTWWSNSAAGYSFYLPSDWEQSEPPLAYQLLGDYAVYGDPSTNYATGKIYIGRCSTLLMDDVSDLLLLGSLSEDIIQHGQACINGIDTLLMSNKNSLYGQNNLDIAFFAPGDKDHYYEMIGVYTDEASEKIVMEALATLRPYYG